MASRPLIKPFPVIGGTGPHAVSGDLSANITSLPTIIDNLSMASYSLSWVGSSPSGAVNVQVSNDYSENADGTVRNAGTWNNLPLSISPFVSGNTGNGFIDIDAQAGYALRLTFTYISGTGVLSALVTGKVT